MPGNGWPVEHIQEVVDRIVAQTRDAIGEPDRKRVVIYHSQNERTLVANISPYEEYLIDLELAGIEIADENYEIEKARYA